MAKTFYVSPGRVYVIQATPGSTVTNTAGTVLATVKENGSLEYVAPTEDSLLVSDDNASVQQLVVSVAGY